METQAPNWVQERAWCTIEALFNELCQRVKADTEEMNRHDPRRDYLYKPDPDTPEKLMGVYRAKKGSTAAIMPEYAVGFSRDENAILVEHFRPNRPTEQFTATPHWDRDKTRALLFVEAGEFQRPCEIWQVSQLALELLFFG